MIGKLNHIAIAVPDLVVAQKLYKDVLGAKVSVPVNLDEHGVRVVFVSLANTKIELLCPLGNNSPLARFLQKNPEGGIHHICYEVDDIEQAKARCQNLGVNILGDGVARKGAHGKPVLFLDPKNFNKTLIELEEA